MLRPTPQCLFVCRATLCFSALTLSSASVLADTPLQRSPSDLDVGSARSQPVAGSTETFKPIDRKTMPQREAGGFVLPDLVAASTEVEVASRLDSIDQDRLPPKENGQQPSKETAGRDPVTVPLPESAADRDAEWNWTIAEWAAPNTFSNPRYFEDRMLERHGHRRWGHLQPAVAGARFFATIPMLPYLMTVREPNDCEYTLGYFRPGSCTPAFLQRPPYERRALVVESAVVAGTMIAFP